jgi:hypothetical protein
LTTFTDAAGTQENTVFGLDLSPHTSTPEKNHSFQYSSKAIDLLKKGGLNPDLA